MSARQGARGRRAGLSALAVLLGAGAMPARVAAAEPAACDACRRVEACETTARACATGCRALHGRPQPGVPEDARLARCEADCTAGRQQCALRAEARCRGVCAP